MCWKRKCLQQRSRADPARSWGLFGCGQLIVLGMDTDGEGGEDTEVGEIGNDHPAVILVGSVEVSPSTHPYGVKYG